MLMVLMSSVRESVGLAIEYVQYALITAQGKGQGNGPLNHQCLTIPRTLALCVADRLVQIRLVDQIANRQTLHADQPRKTLIRSCPTSFDRRPPSGSRM